MQWGRSFEQNSPKIIPSPWGLHCPFRVIHQFHMTLTFNNVHHIAPRIVSRLQFNIHCANTKGSTLYCIHDVSVAALALKDHLPSILLWIISKNNLLYVHGEDVWLMTCSLSSPKIGHLSTCAHWEAPITQEIDGHAFVGTLVAILLLKIPHMKV